MDGFWMEVERIQQRDELREEDSGGNEGQLPEGEGSRRGPVGVVGGLDSRQRNVRGSRYEPEHDSIFSVAWTGAVSSSLLSLLHLCSLLSVLHAIVKTIFQ